MARRERAGELEVVPPAEPHEIQRDTPTERATLLTKYGLSEADVATVCANGDAVAAART
jgi:hypothetical protein